MTVDDNKILCEVQSLSSEVSHARKRKRGEIACCEKVSRPLVGQEMQHEAIGIGPSQRVAGHPDRQGSAGLLVLLLYDRHDCVSMLPCTLVKAVVHV